MRLIVLLLALTGCSVLRDARNELGKDIAVMQEEFARISNKEEQQ
jgi:hypothetical protein